MLVAAPLISVGPREDVGPSSSIPCTTSCRETGLVPCFALEVVLQVLLISSVSGLVRTCVCVCVCVLAGSPLDSSLACYILASFINAPFSFFSS